MKNKIVSLALFSVIALCGCSANEEMQKQQTELQQEITELKNQKRDLENEIVEIKKDKGLEKYFIIFEIKQSHFSLNPLTHAKDEMNAIEIEIMVDEEYYNSVDIDSTISDDFRVGSYVLNGSIGSWDITVVNKEIR